MGYSGRVPCTCIRAGLAPPPDGFLPTFDACGDLVVDRDQWDVVGPWLQTSCGHPEQEVANEWLANAWGMAEFRTWVHELGRHPTLIRWLPTTNDGCIPATDVRAAVAEVDDFRVSAAAIGRCLLVNSLTGDVIRSATERGPALFQLGHGDQIGFDAGGFWLARDLELPRQVAPVVERVAPGVFKVPMPRPSRAVAMTEVFRASRIEQTEVGHDVVPLGVVEGMLAGERGRSTTREVKRYRYVDLDTGASVETPLGVRQEGTDEPIVRFHVEAAPGEVGQFDYVIEPLRRLLVAAAEHGSSVNWR